MENRCGFDVTQTDDVRRVFLNVFSISLSLFLAVPLQDSHFPPVGGKLMKPSMCHTSSLQIPNDKDQALRLPVSINP